jgi:hypothetical protein
MRWLGHVASTGRGGTHTGFMLRKQGGKIPPGRPRRRMEVNIKKHLKQYVIIWIQFSWFRTWTSDGL